MAEITDVLATVINPLGVLWGMRPTPWNPSGADSETKAVGTLVRHVRTPEGHRKYGEDIGEIIHPDLGDIPALLSDVSMGWRLARSRAVDHPNQFPSTRYWVTPDGKWNPVAWHEDALHEPGMTFRQFVDKTSAVRITLHPQDMVVEVMASPTGEQLDAIAAVQRRLVVIGAAVENDADPFYLRLDAPDRASVRDGLLQAAAHVSGRAQFPSRLAQFKTAGDVLRHLRFKSGVIKHVATDKGVEYYDLPLHSPIVPRIKVPKVPRVRKPHAGSVHLGDASKVAAHEADPGRDQRLLELYAEGLPDRGMTSRGGAGLGTEVLFIEKNRSAAKVELVDNILARLDPATKRQLADIAGHERTGLMESMSRNVLMVGKYGPLPDAVVTDPFDHRMIWRKFNWDHSAGVWEVDPYENFANWFPDHVGPWSDGRSNLYVQLNPESGSVHRSPEGYAVDYLRGDDPRLIDALARDQLSTSIRKWADTSNDNDAMSLTIQEAVQQEFGLEGTMGWDARAGDHSSVSLASFDKKMAKEQANLPLYRTLVRAQYDETQDWFKAHGVTELLVYRGMRWRTMGQAVDEPREVLPQWFDDVLVSTPSTPADEEFAIPAVPGLPPPRNLWIPVPTTRTTIPTPQLRPASAWAWGDAVAHQFAGMTGSEVTADHAAAVMATVVPVTSILSTPRTGFGALPEMEVVVLSFGGSVEVKVTGTARRAQLLADLPVAAKTAFLDDIARFRSILQLKRAVPHVRTEAGRKKYGQPIGTPIVSHPHTPTGSMMRRLAKAGGFTIHPSGVEPHTGFAVAKGGHSSITPAAEFFSSEEHAAHIIDAWLKENAEVFDDPAWHIGGWYDLEHDEIVLDPSQVVQDLEEARRIGAARDEQAIFDLKNKVEIPTFGSGGRKSLLPSAGVACSPLPRALDAASAASESSTEDGVVAMAVKALAASKGNGEGIAPSSLLRLGDRFQVTEPLAVPDATEVVYLKALGDGTVRLFVDPPMDWDELATFDRETGVAVVRQVASPEETGAKFRSVTGNGAFDGTGSKSLGGRWLNESAPCVACHNEVRLPEGDSGEEKSDAQAPRHGAADQEDLRDDRRGAAGLLAGDRREDVRAGREEEAEVDDGVLGALARVIEHKAAVKYVATDKGVRYFDQPLKSPIVPHPHHVVPRLRPPSAPAVPALGGRLSTSRPTTKDEKAAYRPGVDVPRMSPDLIGDTALASLIARQAGVPGFEDFAGRTDRAALDEIIDRQAQNIVAAVARSMAVSPEATALHAEWYPYAHDFLTALADERGTNHDAVYAATAILSANADWPANVAWSQRITRMVANQDNIRVPLAWALAWHGIRRAKWEDAQAKVANDGKEFDAPEPQFPGHIVGRLLSELSDGDAAIAIRGSHDSAGGGPGAVRPLGGHAGFGNPAHLTRPQSDANMAKAISVLRNPTTANIDVQLGGNHKVRSFYANLRAPFDTRYSEITADSHHFGLTNGHPWGGKGMFLSGGPRGIVSNPETGSTGAMGTYPLVVEATRRATVIVNAKYHTNWLPNQIQSIVWEQHKAEFPDSIRGNKTMQMAIEAAHVARVRGQIDPNEEWAQILSAMREAGGPTDSELAAWFADDLAARPQQTLTQMRAQAARDAKKAA